MKHKHYEVLTQWLADQTLELEYSNPHSNPCVWYEANRGQTPINNSEWQWRIKPRMVKVGRHSWPMPLEVAPDMGAVYWAAYPGSVVWSQWANDSVDLPRFSAGVIHLSEAAAQQHASALVAINRGDV